MPDARRFNLATARAAADESDDEIARWVGDFLAGSRSDNAVLAAALAQEPHWWFGPVQLPVGELERLADRAGDEVVAIEASVADDSQPPPLLAEWHDGHLLLRHGHHRYEALVRAGETAAWTLVYFPRLEDRDRFAGEYLQALRLPTRRQRDRTPTPDARTRDRGAR